MEYCIPHYGDSRLAVRAVASIFATDPEATVLVGDDTGSLDPAIFVPYKVQIYAGPKQGFAANVNQLVARAKGDWITILNNDVELGTTWWQEMSRVLVTCDDRTFSIASTLVRPSGRIDSLGDAISWFGVGFNRYHLKKLSRRNLVPTQILGATGGLTVLRRNVFVQFGGYSLQLQSYCEDTQLNMRATAHGYRSWYYPAPYAIHQGTSTFTQGKKFYLSARNTILYIRTDYGGTLRRVMLRRVTAYWRMKAVISRHFRADIRHGIHDGYQTVITPYTTPITVWPEGNYREKFVQTQWRLLMQTFASLLRRLRLLRVV